MIFSTIVYSVFQDKFFAPQVAQVALVNARVNDKGPKGINYIVKFNVDVSKENKLNEK